MKICSYLGNLITVTLAIFENLLSYVGNSVALSLYENTWSCVGNLVTNFGSI